MKIDLITEVCKSIFNELNSKIQAQEQVMPKDRYRIFLSWSSEMDSIIKNLYKENEILQLARLYEVIGIFDSNLNTDSEPVYSATSLQCSSCFYFKAGELAFAELVAKRNYQNYLKHYNCKYSHVDTYTAEDLYFVIVDQMHQDKAIYETTESILHDELLGDMCMFFNNELSGFHYSRAKRKITLVDQVDPAYKGYATSQYSWLEPKKHYYPTLQYCLGLDLDFHNYDNFHKRLSYKEQIAKNLFKTNDSELTDSESL